MTDDAYWKEYWADYARRHPCVRSGYCCNKATCAKGVEHGAPTVGCTFLRGPGPGEYRCGLVEDGLVHGDSVGGIGVGCAAPLFNTVRERVLRRRKAKRSASGGGGGDE